MVYAVVVMASRGVWMLCMGDCCMFFCFHFAFALLQAGL